VFLIRGANIDGNQLAIVVALVSAFFTSLAMIGLHRLKRVDPNAVVVHFSMVATVFSGASFFLFDVEPSPQPLWQWQTMAILLGVGLTASLGQMCLTRAFATGEPAKVSVVGLTQVAFTLGLDLLLTDHRLTPMIALGTGLILAPTAWIMMERKPTDIPQPSPTNDDAELSLRHTIAVVAPD
jgi:drug/metabolite transporter (DMT)-like permease